MISKETILTIAYFVQFVGRQATKRAEIGGTIHSTRSQLIECIDRASACPDQNIREFRRDSKCNAVSHVVTEMAEKVPGLHATWTFGSWVPLINTGTKRVAQDGHIAFYVKAIALHCSKVIFW